jgi:hypothetical protein
MDISKDLEGMTQYIMSWNFWKQKSLSERDYVKGKVIKL